MFKSISALLLLAVCGCLSVAGQAVSIVAVEKVELKQGESVALAWSVVVSGAGTRGVEVRLSQTLESAAAMSLGPALPGSEALSGDGTLEFVQTLEALSPGDHKIRLRADVGSAASAQHEIEVTILPPGPRQPVLYALQADPAVLKPDSEGTVRFSIMAGGEPEDWNGQVLVRGVRHRFSLQLENASGDPAEPDGSFAGSARVSTAGLGPGECLEFEAVAGTTVSKPATVCASNLPATFAPPDETNLLTDDRGNKLIADEVLVEFKQRTTEPEMLETARLSGAAIVGALPEIGVYQFRLTERPRDWSTFQRKMAIVARQQRVQRVEPNGISTTEDATTTNDPLLGEQYALDNARIRRAWTIARGGVKVGVIDSGLDMLHEEVEGRILDGWDYVGDDNEPWDGNGHGTHVTGILAGRGNNALGIAGVSWKSKIVPVRTHDSDGAAPNTRLALGIKTMATAIVKVANMSVSSSMGSLTLCNAVEKLQDSGALAVAAAGNQGSSDKRYPAACSGVIAVANLNSANQRVSTSNHGGWVTLAAPGDSIMSTVPTGNCSRCDPSGYRRLGGTSMASPLVAGAAALVAGRGTSLSAGQIREILVNTTIPINTDRPVGRGLLNAVEAVFNGNFESSFRWWTYTGVAGIISQLGNQIAPADGNRMAALYAGGTHPTDETILRQTFIVQGSPYARPRLRVRLAMFGPNILKNATSKPRLSISVGRDNVFTLLGGIDSSQFSQAVTGVSSYYEQIGASWTGWKTFEFDLPGDFAGQAQLRIRMFNDNGNAATGLVDWVQVF